MAAYAALVSVMHIIEQIQHHPRPPISLDRIQVQSLTENVAFLQDFLERYPHDGSNEADDLESRIADAAYAAEDVIESHVVDQITASRSTGHGEKISSVDLFQGLQKVIQDIGFIKKEVMDIKQKSGIKNQLNRNSTPAGSLTSPSMRQTTMVGFDDLLLEIMDKLTGGQLDRQIIPIYGMGGIGKTTLARNIFIHDIIVPHFDILAWATISQQYSIREIFLEIIYQKNKEKGRHLSECELGEELHKHLSGRRYLIVMDDMWVSDVWDKIKCFFPNNNNGSKILVTTRLSNVALQLNETLGFKMNFLDENDSWNLLCKNVFGEEGCPLELEETGKKIAKNCRGLPLSIVVVARVLAKSGQTKEYWDYIVENLSSIVNLEDDEHCLKILSTSYNQLPVHLKPCFLYTGIFNEDSVFRVSSLVKLWVAEGFLKPITGKSLEAVAEEHLKDLIDRNLIFIHSWGSNGRKIRCCKIHDLLRDLCLRQARREKFLCVGSQYKPDIPQGTNSQRRIAFHRSTSRQDLQCLQPKSLVRSLTCDFQADQPWVDFRLLRVLNVWVYNRVAKVSFVDSIEPIFSQLINSRYLFISLIHPMTPDSRLLPSSLYLLWNVQTLIINIVEVEFIAPSEIWKMPQLRHVQFWSLRLSDPPSGHIDGGDDFVMENLLTLARIKDFRCCEGVVKRIPHIKKLKVSYDGIEGWSFSCFKNLGRLKLESLDCFFNSKDGSIWTVFLRQITFPHSLKKLKLQGSRLRWEDITTKIGSLPLLQVLKLGLNSARGDKWETVEEGFPKLKFLEIGSTFDYLKCWMTDGAHFPNLECLVVDRQIMLEKIPSELGNIPTLKLIVLKWCSDSAIFSAKEILDEQEQLGNGDLQVRVEVWESNEELESCKSRNFQVESFLRYEPQGVFVDPLDQILRLDETRNVNRAQNTRWKFKRKKRPLDKFRK